MIPVRYLVPGMRHLPCSWQEEPAWWPRGEILTQAPCWLPTPWPLRGPLLRASGPPAPRLSEEVTLCGGLSCSWATLAVSLLSQGRTQASPSLTAWILLAQTGKSGPQGQTPGQPVAAGGLHSVLPSTCFVPFARGWW